MKKWKKAAVAALTGCLLASEVMGMNFDLANPPVVEIAQGKLMGYMDGDVYAFLGIPYAKAERFEEPRRPESWEGVRSAQAYGPTCPVPEQTTVGPDEMVWPHRYWVQSEDCLNLNIWTTSLEAEAKKPVLVFFHGGGYTNGSSIEGVAYEGRNLSAYGDAVVVTVNHRLNVLGFSDLTDFGSKYAGACNLGIKDLVASLHWVQENIASFGGDPEQVTIFGQSGGGGKVTTLLRTPAAEGLFARAVCMSGLFAGADGDDVRKVTTVMMEKLELTEKDVEALKTMPYDQLSRAAEEAAQEVGVYLAWSPVNDGEYILEDYCEWAKDIPLMVGSCFGEFNYSFSAPGENKNDWTEEEVMEHLTEKFGEKAEAVAEAFAKVFPERPLADAYYYDAYLPWVPISRDGVEEILNHKLDTAEAPVYEYLFDYEAPVNGGTLAFHCSDLIYFFHNVDIPILTRATGGGEAAYKVQDTMASALIAFARTGDPSTEALAWKPYTKQEKNICVFDEESKCTILGDEELIELMKETM